MGNSPDLLEASEDEDVSPVPPGVLSPVLEFPTVMVHLIIIIDDKIFGSKIGTHIINYGVECILEDRRRKT